MESKNMANNNPLASHFRQPAVFLKLPSGGKYWVPDSINMPANGELGVMPMTAKDEIMLRTPDALMNGQGVVSVIQSCIPQIINAWAAPTIDLDAILIAIRLATYGEKMDIDSECPKCNAENKNQMDIGGLLLAIRSPNYDDMLITDGLTFKFKPLNYLQSTKNNIAQFEEQKLIQLINDENLDADTRKAQFDIHLQKIIDSNTNILTLSTQTITTEDGTVVSNPEHIREFYTNANNGIIRAVQDKLKQYSETVQLPKPKIQCEECNHEYNVNVTFDYSNFFVPLS
jgi:hypothetical protein